MTLVEFGNFAAGDLSEFDDASAHGGGSNGVGTHILDSDWVAGKYKARLVADSVNTPVYYSDSSKVRIHLLGNAGVEALMTQGTTIYRALSYRWYGSTPRSIYAGDEIHGSGTTVGDGPAPMNGFELRGSDGQISWVHRGASDPDSGSFVQWGFGMSPRGDENGSNRFSQAWSPELSNVIVANAWYHFVVAIYLHPTNGSVTMYGCRHGDVMANVVPLKTGVGTMFPAPTTHYPMMSLYYNRSATGTHALEMAAGAYADDFAALKTWHAEQVGYDLWDITGVGGGGEVGGGGGGGGGGGSFPTTDVLTTFTGADEDPLSEGGDWASSIRWDGGGGVPANDLRLVSNQAGPSASGANSHCASYWNTSFAADQEVFATVGVKCDDGKWCSLAARIQDPSTSGVDFYALEIDAVAGSANDTWSIYRYNDNSGSLVGSLGTQEFSAGDKIGLEVSGTGATVTLRAYIYTGGVWTQVGSDVEDTSGSRITAAGYIGAHMNDTANAGRWDDFGGGEIVVGGGGGGGSSETRCITQDTYF